MHRRIGIYLASSIILLSGVAVASPAQATQGCHKINARVEGTVDFGTGTVEGQIVGGGILHGIATGSFTFTSPTTFEGSYLITTKHGTLSLQLFNGVIDPVTLTGTNDSVVTGGTGRFTGATGGLFFEGGVEPDGAFTDHLSGKVCLAK